MNWKRYKLILVLAFVASLTVACAGMPRKSRLPEKVKRPVLGVNIDSPSLEVQGFYLPTGMNKSPAAIAGIQEGDTIRAIDQKPVNTDKALIMSIRKHQPGQIVPVTVERNGKELAFDVKLGYKLIKRTAYEFQPMALTIYEILDDNKKPLRLAVFTGEISNTFSSNFDSQWAFEEWKKNIEISIVSHHEQGILNSYGRYSNFTLIDRQRITELLEEQKLSMSGVISRETRNKLGEMLGLTHVYLIDFRRSSTPRNTYVDVETIRLIEVDTGRILEIVRVGRGEFRL